MTNEKRIESCEIPSLTSKKRFIDKITAQSTVLVIIVLMMLFLFAMTTTNTFGLKNLIESNRFIFGIIEGIAYFKFLPIILVLIPVIGGFVQLSYGQKMCFTRDRIVIFSTFLTFVAILFMYPLAKMGGEILAIPNVLMLGLSFKIDMLGFTVLLITSFIWFMVMVYAHEYMKKELKCTRFFFFMALTYSAVLGAIMAGDLLTMFLFFEVMTVASYMLVIHGQKDESYQAGYNYIIMGLIGGFLILSALLLIYFQVGDLRFESAIEVMRDIGSLRYLILGLLVIGFGIKAGMAPVHVWLPRAHPVAPTPASALLSGIMIKVGAFGILRVATSYFFPSKDVVTSFDDPIWLTVENAGAGLIWLGIVTMAIGVFLALQQANIKKMLAYHSVSQMGYIVVGIGVALYLGYSGAMGYAGALYHIINHALFKSLLFMVAGVVYFHTKEYNMYKLGGLYKKLPLTGTVCLIAVLGISGIPLFNGFISKTVLHHGLVESYEYGSQIFRYAEILFVVISAGTFAALMKMFYFVFIQKTENTYPDLKREYTCLDTAMAAVALIIVLIGLFPRFILNQLIIPQLDLTTYFYCSGFSLNVLDSCFRFCNFYNG
jgi:hydrogenase-4 component B